MTNASLVGTQVKVTSYGIPRTSATTVARPRLFSRLNDPAAFPLTVVRGSSGFGKSVLISAWLNQREDDGVIAHWISVDESSSSRSAFWRRVILSLGDASQIDPNAVLTSVDGDRGSDVPGVSDLIRAINSLGSPLILVVDNYHLLDGDAVMTELVAMLQSCPRFRLIVATRVRGPLELAAVTTAIDTLVIGAADLLFDEEETAKVIAASGVNLSRSQVADVHDQTGGWPVGVRVAAYELASRPADLARKDLLELTETATVAYVRDALLSKLHDPAILDFLLRTCVAETVTADLAEHLSGSQGARHLLATIEGEGLATTAIVGGELVYRYVHVLREALLVKAADEMPDELRQLRVLMARWQTARGEQLSAVKHAAQSGDWRLFAEITERQWPELLFVHGSELRNEILSMPRDELNRRPALMALLATTYYSPKLDVPKLVSILRASAVALNALGDRATGAELLSVKCGLLMASRLNGNLAESIKLAEALTRTVRATGTSERGAVPRLVPTILTQAGLTYLSAGKLTLAIGMFDEAWKAGETVDSTRTRYHAASSAALAHALLGDIPTAHWNVVRADGLRLGEAIEGTYLGVNNLLARAHIALASFDAETAIDLIERAEVHGEATESWPLVLALRAASLIQIGDVHAAVEQYERVAALESSRPSVGDAVLASTLAERATALMRLSHGGRANRLIMANDLPSHPGMEAVRLRMALVAGDLEVVLLGTEPWIWRKDLGPWRRAEMLLLKAAASSRLGETASASEHFEQIRALITRYRLPRVLATIPREDFEALQQQASIDGWVVDVRDPMPIPRALKLPQLTKRETLVLEHLSVTPHMGEIADRLFVSPNTVKTQVASVYRKLDANSRQQALTAAREMGLIH